MQVDYHAKYLKYKQKYLDLKEEMIGGNKTLNEADEQAFQAWLKEKGTNFVCSKKITVDFVKNKKIKDASGKELEGEYTIFDACKKSEDFTNQNTTLCGGECKYNPKK